MTGESSWKTVFRYSTGNGPVITVFIVFLSFSFWQGKNIQLKIVMKELIFHYRKNFFKYSIKDNMDRDF